MCNGAATLGTDGSSYAAERVALEPLIADGLVRLQDHRVEATDLGRIFVRNIAMVFDPYLASNRRKFSRTV